ncbi:DUF805 domain-containing protein [Bifidobacterium aemilianum]|nr:DUF805 domain-containing protein [Bifidobacterium aemilianum]
MSDSNPDFTGHDVPNTTPSTPAADAGSGQSFTPLSNDQNPSQATDMPVELPLAAGQPQPVPGPDAPMYGQPQPSMGQESAGYHQGDAGQANGSGQYGQPSQDYGQQIPAAAFYGQQQTSQPQYGQMPTAAPLPQGNYAAASMPWGAPVPLTKPYYGCSFIEAIKRFFMNYANFSGRASRSEYWWSFLFIALVELVLSLLNKLSNYHLGFLNGIWVLAILIPSIAIFIRRLHDSNKSGLWVLLPIGMAFIGTIVVVISLIGGAMGSGDILAIDGDLNYAALAGAGIGSLIGILIFLAAYLADIVLMILNTDPAGARFDKDAQFGGPSGQMMGQMPGANGYTPQDFNQYGQPTGQPFYGQPTTPTAYAPSNPNGQQTAGQQDHDPNAGNQQGGYPQNPNPYVGQ